MKLKIALSCLLFAAMTSLAFANSNNSSFQLTCSNISFAYMGNDAALQATCLRANGTPNDSSLLIKGISNQNGRLVNSGGPSSFQRSCGNIQINVTLDNATLSAFCRTMSGSFNETSIPLNGISNQNGNLTY